MFRWTSKDKLHGLCFCLLLTVKEQRALEQATGPDRALLSVLITASHLSHCPALSEAEEVLGCIRRIILSEADISPTISCSVPPSFTLFVAFLPLELLWKIWKAPWWEMFGFSWEVTGFNTFFSCLCRDRVVPQKKSDHQEFVPLGSERGNCTVLSSMCIVSASQVMSVFDIICLKIQPTVWNFTWEPQFWESRCGQVGMRKYWERFP